MNSPREVAIPLAIGCFLGQSLVVGMEVKIEAKPEDVHSAFCICVEICDDLAVGRSMSLLFAPFSGLCYMQYRGDSCLLSTPALPALDSTFSGPLEAWAKVSPDGSIYFLRKADDIQATGRLPKSALPQWACEYFVCAHLWRGYLPKSIEMSVIYSSQKLPCHLRDFEPESYVTSTWHHHY